MYDLKKYLENIINGYVNDSKIEDKKIIINEIENSLNKLKETKKIKELKYYIKKIKKSIYEKDKIRTEQARSFEDQKGKGYVDLPILLSKIYTNNTADPSALARSSKELINDIKKLVKNLYKNKQITKQVYNTLSSLELYK